MKPMSPKVELEMVARAQAGDGEAMDTLILQWRPWVLLRVKHWIEKSHGWRTKAHRWITSDDLLSAGLVGMWKGIRKWKHKARLGTYATHWIDHEIRRAMIKRLIHIPANEIGKRRDVSDKVYSVDSPGIFWSTADLRIRDPAELAIENMSREETRKTINRVSGRMLTKRQARILRMHAIDGMTDREIADNLGISLSRVSFVRREAIKTLGASEALRRLSR